MGNGMCDHDKSLPPNPKKSPPRKNKLGDIMVDALRGAGGATN